RRSMPSSTGPDSCSTERPILPSPRALRVPRWRPLWPIWLFTCVMRTLAMLGVVLLLAAYPTLGLLFDSRLRLGNGLRLRGRLGLNDRLSLNSGVRHRWRGVRHLRLRLFHRSLRHGGHGSHSLLRLRRRLGAVGGEREHLAHLLAADLRDVFRAAQLA